MHSKLLQTDAFAGRTMLSEIAQWGDALLEKEHKSIQDLLLGCAVFDMR